MLNFETHSSAPYSSTIQIILMECNNHSHMHIENAQKKRPKLWMLIYSP